MLTKDAPERWLSANLQPKAFHTAVSLKCDTFSHVASGVWGSWDMIGITRDGRRHVLGTFFYDHEARAAAIAAHNTFVEIGL